MLGIPAPVRQRVRAGCRGSDRGTTGEGTVAGPEKTTGGACENTGRAPPASALWYQLQTQVQKTVPQMKQVT